MQVISTAATVLVGAVELYAFWKQVNPRLQQKESEKTTKAIHEQKNDKGAKKANTPVSFQPLDDSAEQQERE